MMSLSIFDLSSNVAYLIFETAWKSTIILGGVILLGKLLKRQSASVRQTVFSTGVLTMLAFIIFAPVFPRWTVFTPNWLPALYSKQTAISTAPVSAANSVNADSQAVETVSESIPNANSQSAPIYKEEASGIDFTILLETLIASICLIIAVLLGGRLWMNLLGLKRLKLASVVHNEADLNSLVQDIARKFKCSRRIVILQNDAIEMPLTWGIFRHVILLPKDFEKLPAESRRAVLTHELNHIERYDFVARTLTEIMCAILWFQPLGWILRRRLREEQEKASDDRVLATCAAKASAYAKLLLDWQDRLSSNNPLSVAAGMTGRGGLKSRVDAILDPNLKRRPAVISEIIIVWLVTLGLAIPLGGLIFSREVVSAESTSVENFSESETSFQTFNDSSNEREIASQNSRVEAQPKKAGMGKSPVKETADATSDAKKPKTINNAKEIIPANEAESKRKVENVGRRSETNSSPVAPTETTNFNAAAKTSLAERNEKDAVSGGDQPKTEKPSQVRQVFENIRQGFKNGKKPINIFDP